VEYRASTWAVNLSVRLHSVSVNGGHGGGGGLEQKVELGVAGRRDRALQAREDQRGPRLFHRGLGRNCAVCDVVAKELIGGGYGDGNPIVGLIGFSEGAKRGGGQSRIPFTQSR
jgi:hypothetical protein